MLTTTQAKIEKSLKNYSNSKSFYHHEDWDKTTTQISKFLKNKKTVFFYLDAVLDSSIDKYQGLSSIIDAVDSTMGQINILIDSRLKAVANLHLLSTKLDKSLMVSTNWVNYRKSPSQSEQVRVQCILDSAFLRMSSSTFVSSLH